MKKQLPLLLIGLLYFFATAKVSAVTITLTNIPSTITTDSFTLNASISGATAGTNYLRVDLYKETTQNYFGETNGASGWYGGSDYTQYLPITIVSGQGWSGTIQGKVGSPTATEYDGSGTYKLRVRRYTAAGNYTSSEAEATSTSIVIAYPTITPTPLPTNTPAPPPTPIPTLKPSATPVKIPTVIKALTTPTRILSVSPTATVSALLSPSLTPVKPSLKTEVLGASSKPNVLQLIFLSGGGILFISCGILLFFQWKKYKQQHL